MAPLHQLSWSMLLSHHSPQGLDRCLVLPLARRRIHICARCAGLYPALACATAARLLGFDLPTEMEPYVVHALPLAGGAAWVADQGGISFPNYIRVMSGALLGLGIGWALAAHLRQPWPQELLTLCGWLVALGLAGFVARLVKRDSDRWDRSGLDGALAKDGKTSRGQEPPEVNKEK